MAHDRDKPPFVSSKTCSEVSWSHFGKCFDLASRALALAYVNPTILLQLWISLVSRFLWNANMFTRREPGNEASSESWKNNLKLWQASLETSSTCHMWWSWKHLWQISCFSAASQTGESLASCTRLPISFPPTNNRHHTFTLFTIRANLDELVLFMRWLTNFPTNHNNSRIWPRAHLYVLSSVAFLLLEGETALPKPSVSPQDCKLSSHNYLCSNVHGHSPFWNTWYVQWKVAPGY